MKDQILCLYGFNDFGLVTKMVNNMVSGAKTKFLGEANSSFTIPTVISMPSAYHFAS